jgi:homoserine kinase type II
VQCESGLWMVSPFAPGHQTDREDMSPEEDRGMGKCLAKLIRVLSTCPKQLGKRRRLQVDVQKTLEEIDRIETLIRSHPTQQDYEQFAVDRLRGRRSWIECHANETTDGLEALAHQVIHGDYQEKNVFFDDLGEVVGLIDWDNAWTAPPEWEIIRTLNFVMDFDPARGTNFIEGYRASGDLDLESLDRAAWAYGVSRTHDLWLFKEIYKRGNERARRFQRPGAFQPVYDRWVPLRDALERVS